jgi:hypothetical protein
LQAEITAFTTALQNYSTDQSVANCNAYKNALQAYVNALAPYGDCAVFTTQQRAHWQAALAEAQADVNELNCSATQ